MKKFYSLLVIFLLCVSCTQPQTIEEHSGRPVIHVEPVKTLELEQFNSISESELLSFKRSVLYPDYEEYKNRINIYQDYNYIIEKSASWPDFDYLNSLVEADIKNNRSYEPLTYEEAIEDINQFMDIIQYGFGGFLDSTNLAEFEKRKNLMIGLVPVNGIEFYQLRDILMIGGSLIKDKHFWVENSAPIYEAGWIAQQEQYNQFLNPEEFTLYSSLITSNLKLYKNEKNDYIDLSNGKKIISSLDLVKPVVNSIGDYYHSIIISNPYYPQNKPLEIVYQDNSTKKLEYEEFFTNYNYEYPYQQAEIIDNVLVINFTEYVFQQDTIPDYDTIIEKTKQVPIVLIDLRNNRGGNQWMATELILQLILNDRNDWSPLGQHYDIVTPTTQEVEVYDPELQFLDHGLIITKHSEVELPEINDQLIVLLIDNNTSSAGEYFIGDLIRSKNVITMGSNTGGLATSAVGQLYVLNNSQFTLRVPDQFMAYNLETYTVQQGYQPDIWLNDVPLEKVVEFLNSLKLDE